MATVNLGNIKFNWKGAYNSSTAYVVDDVVSSSGSSYICILASTGNAPTNTTYWEQMSQAGTDGTDLSTTVTTQGDIVYRDGSGLARLGAGTSGQVLQTNGTGANPSWATVSSDFVRLASLTQTSEVQSVSIDGYFTSDYDVYKLYLMGGRADGNKFQVQVNHSGTAQTSASYQYMATYNDLTTGNTPSVSTSHSINDTQFRIGWQDDTANRRLNAELIILDPLNTERYKAIFYKGSSFQGSYWYQVDGFAQYESTTALSGITLKGHSSSFNIGFDHAYLYGLKNS